jgi:uncharacterized protein (TIGR00369 family)
MDAASMGRVLARIPYTRDLGLVIEQVKDGEVWMMLPDHRATQNLAGTVHAGALFTFGETVAGVAAGLQTLDRAFPFARRAEIRYRRPAQGSVRGRAGVAAAEVARIVEEIERDGRSELSVSAVLETADGETIAEVEVEYAFRPIGGKS